MKLERWEIFKIISNGEKIDADIPARLIYFRSIQ